MRIRWRIVGLVGTPLVASFCVLWLSCYCSDYGSQDAFRLELIRQIQQGPTNILIFRLNSLGNQGTYFLPNAGWISVPANSNQASPSSLVGDGYPAPLYGRWAPSPLPPAQSATNFAPTIFKGQTDFAIVAPTNAIWRLNARPCRVLSRLGVIKYKSQRAWTCLKTRDFQGLSRAWSGPSDVTLNYQIWSDAHTNAPKPL